MGNFLFIISLFVGCEDYTEDFALLNDEIERLTSENAELKSLISDNTNSIDSNTNINKVKTFTEKPNRDLALQFLDSGDFLWNAGIFLFASKVIIDSYRKDLRDIYDIFKSGEEIYGTSNEEDFINRIFSSCKNISIDYGILEKSDIVYVYPSNFGWSDLGTWGSIDTHLPKDDENNTIRGGDVQLHNSKDNIVILESGKECIINGLTGYIVVESDNSLLICNKADEQEIKKFTLGLKSNK